MPLWYYNNVLERVFLLFYDLLLFFFPKTILRDTKVSSNLTCAYCSFR